jgi:hypothetical protein
MKATLEFDLNEEKFTFESATKGRVLVSVIQQIDTYIRNKIKYGELPQDQENLLHEIRTELWGFVNEEGLTDLFG